MNRRPYYLDLIRIRLPIGGLVSILHRASGALLSLGLPGLLYLFMLSLRSADDFQRLGVLFSSGPGWLAGVVATWALLHHVLAGLRHLGFDFGLGEQRGRARLSAQLTLWLAIGLTALLWLGAAS